MNSKCTTSMNLSNGNIHQKPTGPTSLASWGKCTAKCTMISKKNGGYFFSNLHKINAILSSNFFRSLTCKVLAHNCWKKLDSSVNVDAISCNRKNSLQNHMTIISLQSWYFLLREANIFGEDGCIRIWKSYMLRRRTEKFPEGIRLQSITCRWLEELVPIKFDMQFFSYVQISQSKRSCIMSFVLPLMFNNVPTILSHRIFSMYMTSRLCVTFNLDQYSNSKTILLFIQLSQSLLRGLFLSLLFGCCPGLRIGTELNSLNNISSPDLTIGGNRCPSNNSLTYPTWSRQEWPLSKKTMMTQIAFLTLERWSNKCFPPLHCFFFRLSDSTDVSLLQIGHVQYPVILHPHKLSYVRMSLRVHGTHACNWNISSVEASCVSTPLFH